MIRALALVLAVCLSWARGAHGHAMAPALFEISALDTHRYAIAWKVGLVQPLGLTLRPVLPAECVEDTAPGQEASADSVTTRWVVACGGQGLVGVAGLVGLHGLEDAPRMRVAGRQAGEVLVEVGLDLALGLDHEAQVPAVAAQAGGHADGIAAGVPQRVEQARPAVEGGEAPGAPGQVVGFLLRRFQQLGAHRRVACHRGLAAVQGLGADLAGVVHPHQSGDVAALGLVQFDGGQPGAGIGAAGHRGGEQGAERALGLAQPVVERAGGMAEGAGVHRRCGWQWHGACILARPAAPAPAPLRGQGAG